YEPSEFLHTPAAVTSIRMNGWIIKEDAIATGFELLPHDVTLIGAPIRVIHARGFVVTAVPGAQWLPVAILLPPLGWRRMELLFEFRRPIAIEMVQLYN